jgi:putative spermidine/putrescine transport system substrate-binding protein
MRGRKGAWYWASSVGLLLVLVCTTFVQPTAGGPRETLVVSGFGGAWERAVRRTVIEPFERQFNVSITLALPGNSTQILAKMRAEKANPSMDVVVIGGGLEQVAAAEGLMERLNYANIPNTKDIHASAMDSPEYGPSIAFSGVGLGFHLDRIKPYPISWFDLWDPKYRGRVAINEMSGNPGLAFFAFLNEFMGGSETNTAPGWRKLKELVETQKPIIARTTDEQVIAVVQREALLVQMFNSRAAQLASEGFPLGFIFPKEGGFGWGNYTGVPRGSRQKQLAEQFINFWLDPDVQVAWSTAIHYGPTNLKAKLPDTYPYRHVVMYGPDTRRLRPLNWNWINKNRAAWIERWNKEVVPLLSR